MTQFVISYSAKETIVDSLTTRAAQLNISTEELIKRLIDIGMRETDQSPSLEAATLNEFLSKNGALKS